MADVQMLNTTSPSKSKVSNLYGDNKLGSTIGGITHSVAPGIGTAIGSTLGAAVQALFSGGSLTGRSSRKKWKQSNANYYNQFNNALTNLNSSDKFGFGGQDNSDLLNDYLQYINDMYTATGKGFKDQSTDALLGGFANKYNTQQKNSLTNYANNLFRNFGTTNDYLNTAWNMNADDEFNTNFLDNYYNDAMSRLDTAKSRGLLNDYGYNSALNTLNTRRSAATGELNSLTDDVLNNYRDDLANYASGVYSGIDSYDLSNRHNFNSNSIQQGYDALYGQQQQDLTNNLNNAVAGFQPFDVADILANARNTQGVVSTGQNSDLLASLKERDESNKGKIGLGNQGIF